MVKIVELLIVGLVFMALFPAITNLFFSPTWYVSTIGNNATYTNDTAIGYPTLYNTIFGLVPLLVVVALLYYFWAKSSNGKGGLKV